MSLLAVSAAPVAWAGTFALALVVGASLVCVGWYALAAFGRVRPPARWAATLPFVGAVAAVAAVEWALLTHDFAVRFVAENGSRETAPYYTVTSLWAAHDGSLLLWVLLLTGFLALEGWRRKVVADLHRIAVATLALVAAFFAGLALGTSHLFDAVSPVPSDGPGPNPLLASHPAMGVHPPLLYAGLLGMAVPFAYAIGALVTGRTGPVWVAAVRRSALVAWVLLTAGIVVGAWWSYAVLGWGGYWAWDPVENASLMPWLVATALLHSLMVQRSRRALPAWNLALALAAFLLSCLAALLTRSDLVASVHAFAASAVGPLLLGFLASLVVGIAVLALMRGGGVGPSRPVGPPLSRGPVLLVNNVLLVAICVTVLVGTVYPLAVDASGGGQLSVGAPYYDRVALPLAAGLLLAMVVGPLLPWRRARAEDLVGRLALPVAIGCVTVVLVTLLAPAGLLPVVSFGLAATLSSSIVLEIVRGARRGHASEPGLRLDRRRAGGLVVHLGVAVVAVGIAASSAYHVVAERELAPGQSTTVAGTTVRLQDVTRRQHRGTTDTTATVAVRLAGQDRATTMSPGLTYYPAHDTTVAVPAVASRLRGDVYLTLMSASARHATVRVAVNPLVGWIWGGGAVMVLGAAVAGWPVALRRRRSQPAPVPVMARVSEPVP